MTRKTNEAHAMANLIEKWLGNPLSKSLIRFCTKRDRCGRRIDIALRDYIGDKQKKCIGCRTASFIIRKVLNTFVKKLDVNKEDIMNNLNDPMWRKGLAAVLEGIGLYGVRKPFVASAPFLVVWNITRACNLNCKHCYEDAHTPRKDELTTEEALEAVDKMADAGVAYIAVSGGEPLMRPDLFEIAKRIKENKMAFSIATNGTLLTKENVKKLEDVNCRYVQISLDGLKDTHNSFRGAKSFERTIEGIKNAVDSNITVGIAMTVTKYNIKEVPAIIDLTEKLGADIFMHYNFIPTGRGKDIVKFDISPKQREDLLKFLAKENKKRKIKLLSTAPQFARVSVECFGTVQSTTHFDIFSAENDISFLAEFIGGCGAGRLYCALEPNGDIEPCVFIPIKIGNILKDDLVDVWQNNEILKTIRDREYFEENCGKCKNRNICGGCRARAYAYFNNLRAFDPGCIKNTDL